MKTKKTYALIHFKNKKPIKRNYSTASAAFYDFEEKGCTLVELFDHRGILLSSIKN